VPHIFIDVSNLAYRAFYAIDHLSHDGVAVQVVYGVLRDVKQLREVYGTNDLSFFFDHPHYYRREHFPWYKTRKKDELRDSAAKIVHKQVDRLREELLPALGYENLFQVRGFEADDLIAVGVKHTEDVVIVSSDEDLYQLLRRDVTIRKPRHGTLFGMKDFLTEYHGLPPSRWNEVKAIAGCKSDCISGAEGVGDYVAARYLTGKLSKGVRYNSVEAWLRTEMYRDNLRLTTIPYRVEDATPKALLFTDPAEYDRRAWNGVVTGLGMKSLTDVRRGLKK
jgi:5'-3' exonuclease